MTLASGTRLGPYQIIAPLGAGGMGEVYRARDTRLGREVAVKILPQHAPASADERARFRREAKTISSLNHPHICVLHDIGQEGDTDYLVMELIEGETLARKIAKGPLSTAEVLRIGAQIADALDRAHRAGVVHRDLKPGNIMLTKSGAKLMDFGLAREFKAPGHDPDATVTDPVAGASEESITKKGMIVGTFQYMAPEQLEGQKADARSDIWALGCVLYEMATGKRAFEGSTPVSVISAIMRDEPRRMSELVPLTPPAFERLVRQCLAKGPDDRWQTAGDLRRELIWILEGVPSAGTAARLTTRRRTQTLAAALLAIAGLVAAGIVASLALGPVARRAAHPSFTRMTFKPMTINKASFAPDMKTVVLGAALEGNTPRIYLLRPERPEPEPLSEPGTHLLSVSSKGELAVLTGAQPLGGRTHVGTLARLPLGGGTPREILPDVTDADWDPSGTQLAIIRTVGAVDRIEFPIGNVLYESNGYLSDLAFSPRGDWIAYMEHPSKWDTRGSVRVVNLHGKAKTLSDGYWGEEGAAWAPNGKEILFSASYAGSEYTVFGVDLKGKRRTILMTAGGLTIHDVAHDGRLLGTHDDQRSEMMVHQAGQSVDRNVTWLDYSGPGVLSADAKTIAFSEQSAAAGINYSVCIRDVGGGPVALLGEGIPMELSRDGKWVLTSMPSNPPKFVLIPTGAGQSRILEGNGLAHYGFARFTRAGDSLLIIGRRVGEDRGHWYVQGIRGGSLRRVSRDLGPGVGLIQLSQDGKRMLCRHDTQLFVVERETGSRISYPAIPKDSEVFLWSEDEKSVLLSVPPLRRVPFRLERVGLETGRRSSFAEIRPGDLVGLSHILLTDVTPDGRSFAYVTYWRRSILYAVTFDAQ